MIAAWMLYATVVATLCAGAAHSAERALQLAAHPGRWAWAAALLLACLAPLATPTWRGSAAHVVEVRAPGRVPATGASRWRRDVQSLTALPRTVAVAPGSALAALDRPLLVLWLAGSVGWCLVLAASAIGVARQSAEWRPAVVDGVPVLVSHGVGPALIGVLAPEIVLPAWALNLDPSARRLAVAHEREHARTRDPLLLAAGAVVLVAMPWNAALWFAFSRLRLAIEADCDARVLRAYPDVRAYGSLLVDVSERTLAGAAPVAALAESSSHLARRLDLMTVRPTRLVPLRLAGAALTSLAFAVVACRAPHPSPTPVAAQPQVATSPADSARVAALNAAISAKRVALDRNLGARSEETQRADTSAVLTRVEESPPASATDSHGFGRACARRLRDATDGREYLLRKSSVETKTHEESATVTTHLERAMGDYDVIGLAATEPKSRRLRVDCVTGRTVGWVEPGA